MAKTNQAANERATGEAKSDANVRKGTTGRSYKSTRAKLNLDGFLFVGTKAAPLLGSVEGRIEVVIKRDEGSFFVLHVDNVEGALLLTNRDTDEGEPFAPKSWADLRVGVSGFAALSNILDNAASSVGKQILIEYGGMRENPKSGRMFREINVFEAEDTTAPNGKAQATARA
jgi:hypothetical protein